MKNADHGLLGLPYMVDMLDPFPSGQHSVLTKATSCYLFGTGQCADIM